VFIKEGYISSSVYTVNWTSIQGLQYYSQNKSSSNWMDWWNYKCSSPIKLMSFSESKKSNAQLLFIYLLTAWEHWPNTREFNTWSAEYWKRGIRLSRYYNRV